VLFDTLVLSPAISLCQAWLSSSIVKHLRMSLASKQEEFLQYYRGGLPTCLTKGRALAAHSGRATRWLTLHQSGLTSSHHIWLRLMGPHVFCCGATTQ
jgi:hypothetical protein